MSVIGSANYRCGLEKHEVALNNKPFIRFLETIPIYAATRCNIILHTTSVDTLTV